MSEQETYSMCKFLQARLQETKRELWNEQMRTRQMTQTIRTLGKALAASEAVRHDPTHRNISVLGGVWSMMLQHEAAMKAYEEGKR